MSPNKHRTARATGPNPSPVMSPLGSALAGLKVGSEILFVTPRRTDVVRIERVSRGDPSDLVRALFCNPAVRGKKLSDDDDPEPTAA
jgi:regulator of nucleoside diphosphate kinase